jgi:hypothetical protein
LTKLPATGALQGPYPGLKKARLPNFEELLSKSSNYLRHGSGELESLRYHGEAERLEHVGQARRLAHLAMDFGEFS